MNIIACETIAKLGIVESHDKVIELLNQKNDYTREVAIRCLPAIWKERDFDIIYSIFKMILLKT
jgi:hypothetical protein